MPWVQYEVWSVDEDGHEEVIDTTNSLEEAKQLVETTLKEVDNGVLECIIYQERDGELQEIEVIVRD